MRKRLVKALVAVVVIALVALFVSQPKEGSAKWHKRKYLEAKSGSRVVRFLHSTWFRASGRQLPWPRPYTTEERQERNREMEKHKEALLKLGFLEKRAVIVSNQKPSDVIYGMMRARGAQPLPNFQFVSLGYHNDEEIVITAVAEDMPELERLARQADNVVMLPRR